MSNNETSIRPLFHIGFMKTGSTWLQKKIFCQYEIGFGLPGTAPRAILISELITNNGYLFDPIESKKVMDDAWKKCLTPNIVPVWSDETLLGNPLIRGYHGYAVAKKIYAINPKAKILICIREQMSMAVSLYREYIRQGNTHNFQTFIGTGHEKLSYTPILRPDFLDYSHAVNCYQELFGKENVLVLPFELLKSNSTEFLSNICSFCGLTLDSNVALAEESANVGFKGFSIHVKRILNKFIYTNPLTPTHSLSFRLVNFLIKVIDRLTPGAIHAYYDSRLKHEALVRYKNLYSDSNTLLSKKIDIDLSEFGYDCKSDIAGIENAS